jgi:hypothetical protein
MAEKRLGVVVLDCMSYTQAMKEQIRLHCPARIVLAVSLAARAIQELLH